MTIHLLYFHANSGQENSMERWWFNSMLFKKECERRCGLNKSMGSCWRNRDNSSCGCGNVDYLFGLKDIWNFISDDTFLVSDRKGDSYSIYFDIENQIFEIDNDHSFLSELESSFYSYRNSSYLNNGFRGEDPYYNSYIYIDNYLQSQICIDTSIISGSENYGDSYIYRVLCGGESRNSSENEGNSKIQHLWVQCENCYGLNYKKFFKSKMNICEQCGYHLKMSGSDRIELLIDPGTWDPMDEDMVSPDPIEFHSEEEPYKDHIDSYQRKTGLTEAVQTGIGQLNDILIAIGVMDFRFMGGSMGSVVGEKITRLIEHAANQTLPLIIVCASGARMREGSLSLMQMAKISYALYDYQLNKKLFYASILTSSTTGGVTASFGMLWDIIIAEPNAYIAFAGSQAAEYLSRKGLFDLIVPRNLLKSVRVSYLSSMPFFL
ncbi:unnamed protein product [Withania somnifera]